MALCSGPLSSFQPRSRLFFFFWSGFSIAASASSEGSKKYGDTKHMHVRDLLNPCNELLTGGEQKRTGW